MTIVMGCNLMVVRSQLKKIYHNMFQVIFFVFVIDKKDLLDSNWLLEKELPKNHTGKFRSPF